MAQASALATGGTLAFPHVAPVVQKPLRPSYRDCTTCSLSNLAEATTSSLYAELDRRGRGLPQQDVAIALQELVATMAAMAEGTASPSFHLSSLDPGVGKTTALIHFVHALLRSDQHKDVSVLLCFWQVQEIAGLVKDMGLDGSDFAVLTSEDWANELSSTPSNDARILFTTHSMIKSRCRGRGFGDAEVFHYQGQVRDVRIWDEAMLPGEVVSIDTDQLAALRDPLRTPKPELVEMVQGLERDLMMSGDDATYDWPDIQEATGVSLWSAKKGQRKPCTSYLDSLYALSGRCVLLRKTSNASTVITALDSRDAIPDDLAPVVILDASGRVRSTYSQWEKLKGNLVRLPSAVRNYRNLTVRVMDTGSGKTVWRDDGEALALEVAKLIDSKPNEEWLVIYHQGVNGGAIPDQIMGLLSSDPSRVRFLNWGKHQGTNEFRHIHNVVLTGLNNYAETDYEMAARHYGEVPNDQDAPKTLVDDMQAGEHSHHILQALCRSALRQGSGLDCGPCNAYIIAPKRSGVRRLLPQVFPGCKVGTWKPTKQKAKGKVQEALAYVQMYFEDYPDGVLQLKELRSALDYDDTSNFNRCIRKHDSFNAGLEKLGVEEVIHGNGRHYNALRKQESDCNPFAKDEDDWDF